MRLPCESNNLAAAVMVASARWAGLLQVLLLLATCGPTQQVPATIGDGRVSLYTGRPINGSLSSPSPGSCEVDGLHYPSETAIPRDHPCHYCICYRSQVTCYWKQCAAAPLNCAVMHFENVCNPSLYMCNIPEKARPQPIRKYGDRIFSVRRRRQPRSPSAFHSIPTPFFPTSYSTSGLAPFAEPFPVELNEEFLTRVKRGEHWTDESDTDGDLNDADEEGGEEVEAEEDDFQQVDLNTRQKRRIRRRREIGNPLYRKAGSKNNHHDHHHHHHEDKGCTILGVRYNLGEVIGVASDVCMECRCAAGKMFCSPRCCFLPSPLSLTLANLQALTSAAPPPARPHPLHYIRNQISTR